MSERKKNKCECKPNPASTWPAAFWIASIWLSLSWMVLSISQCAQKIG